MTDEQNAADRHRDQATDDDSPHAHQAPERRSCTDTRISTLTARWPTVLALVLILIPVIVLGGADVELAPGPAVMAGIYMVAYALGRPAAAWAAWPSLVVVLHAIRAHHHDIYAGSGVNPYTAALEAGLDPDSPYYRKAMEYLQAEDVLEWAEESRGLAGSPLYTITLRCMEMLREVCCEGRRDAAGPPLGGSCRADRAGRVHAPGTT